MVIEGAQFSCHGGESRSYYLSCGCLTRKKKGEMPTGIMAHIAKASGCTSVHDLLEKGSDVVAAAQAILKVNGSDKVLLFYSPILCCALQ